jgi:hypothetical protein
MTKSFEERIATEPKEVAALVYFKAGTDLARVEKWLARLQAEAHVEAFVAREYPPAIGQPVWYIP